MIRIAQTADQKAIPVRMTVIVVPTSAIKKATGVNKIQLFLIICNAEHRNE